MAELMLRDPKRFCPDCGHCGRLDFIQLLKFERTYVTEDGEFHDHLGPARDYECRNCGAAFTLTDWDTVLFPEGKAQ